jgi:hypothetical protein
MQAALAAHGITCSMSRRGHCYDNSVMEAFFATAKNEVGERFGSHGEAKAHLFDYIEVFYNQRRRHSSAGRMSPDLRTTNGSSRIVKPSTRSDQAQMSKRAMGPMVIVIVTPRADHGLCVRDRFEAVHVQTFVTKTAVETLDKRVLHGLSGPNEAKATPRRWAHSSSAFDVHSVP